jgi:hypothetical protein
MGGAAGRDAGSGFPVSDPKLKAALTGGRLVNPRLHLSSNASENATGLLEFPAYHGRYKNRKRGGVMNIQNSAIPEQQGFSTQDVLWALGVWSVILSLSPVIMFYVLMVA